MDFRQLFKSSEKFVEFIHKTDEIYQEHEEYFNGLVNGIESKFRSLIDDKPLKQDEFVVPDIPKPKKEPKEKRESRAAKKMLSIANKSINPSDTVVVSKVDDDPFRRSARIASKSKFVKDSISTSSTHSSPPSRKSGIPTLSSLPSPSLPPAKIRRVNDTEPLQSNSLKQMLDETVCTADMKQPLGSSTPTDVSENKENMNVCPDTITKTCSPIDDMEPKTPISKFNREVKAESVKKRIEEFEKRAIVSKLPVKTPEKKQLSSVSKIKNAEVTCDVTDNKSKVFMEKELIIPKGRTTRNNSKVLREQSANIKLLKDKGEDALKKKEVIMKASAEEAKRKREERNRKAAARREAAEKEKLELAIKLEKEKEEKMKLLQKQKEEKTKQEHQKKKQATNSSKSESYEYAIDHVLDGASSDEEEKPKNPIPPWASKESRKHQLKIQTWLNKEKIVYPWFYNKNLKYPKLEELFSADVKMRPRTSSAFWNTKVTFDESFPIT